LLHPPYTLWHLSYAALGAGLAPVLDWWRLGLTLLVFFAGTGVAAVENAPFTEAAAAAGGHWIREGHRLMEAFLGA